MNINRAQAKMILDTIYIAWMKGSLSEEQSAF